MRSDATKNNLNQVGQVCRFFTNDNCFPLHLLWVLDSLSIPIVTSIMSWPYWQWHWSEHFCILCRAYYSVRPLFFPAPSGNEPDTVHGRIETGSRGGLNEFCLKQEARGNVRGKYGVVLGSCFCTSHGMQSDDGCERLDSCRINPPFQLPSPSVQNN
jgi:hypothetical protein